VVRTSLGEPSKSTFTVKACAGGAVAARSSTTRTPTTAVATTTSTPYPTEPAARPVSPIRTSRRRSTRRNGTLLVDGQEVAFDSPSRTVGELLTAYRVVLAGDDYTSPSVDSVLNDGDQVTVYRVGGETKQRTEPIPFTDEHVPDPNTPIGQTSELRPGQNGLMTITYRERIENGVIVGDSVLSEVPTIPAVSHLIGDGTQADWHWDALANCESGGRWNTVDPATPAYDGGIGIYRGTWIAFGGRQFAPNAGLATREQQIIIGQRIEAQYGWTAWGCGRYMGW